MMSSLSSKNEKLEEHNQTEQGRDFTLKQEQASLIQKQKSSDVIS